MIGSRKNLIADAFGLTKKQPVSESEKAADESSSSVAAKLNQGDATSSVVEKLFSWKVMGACQLFVLRRQKLEEEKEVTMLRWQKAVDRI